MKNGGAGFRQIKAALNARAEEVVRHLFPEARREGASMRVGSVDGEKGASLSVLVTGADTGAWKDFSDEGKQGDLIELWKQARRFGSNIEALTEIRGWLGMKDPYAAKVKAVASPPEPPADPPVILPLSGSALAYVVSRGISKATAEAAGVGMSEDGRAVAFPCPAPDGSYSKVKFLSLLRDEQGKKRIWWTKGGRQYLFGMAQVPGDARSLVVCEGEIDWLSWLEAGVPAVSIPDGCTSDGWIDLCYEFLGRFEEFLVSFDEDEPGQAGALRVMKRLGHENCRLVKLPKKDANDCLKAGVDLAKIASEATAIDPDHMVFAGAIADDAWSTFALGPRSERGTVMLGFDPDEFNFRLRPREMTVYTGYNGAGKSTLIYQMIAWLCAARGERVFIGSYEEPCKEILAIMATQAHGRPFTGPAAEPREMFDAALRYLGDRVTMHETESTVDYREFFDIARYACRRYGATHVFLDSLTKTNVDPEDNALCKKFMEDACSFFQATGAHLHVVAHPRKPAGIQFAGKKQRASKFDVKGSGVITDLAYNVISVYRPGADEQARYDAEIICGKQKVGGWEGSVSLNFSQDNFRFFTDTETAFTPYAPQE